MLFLALHMPLQLFWFRRNLLVQHHKLWSGRQHHMPCRHHVSENGLSGFITYLSKIRNTMLSYPGNIARDCKPITAHSHEPILPSLEPISDLVCTHIDLRVHHLRHHIVPPSGIKALRQIRRHRADMPNNAAVTM